MTDAKRPLPEHDEFEQYAQAEASQESKDSPFNILVSVPESIRIRMVDATSLSDYEIWFFGSGALLSVLTGFLVAYIQEDKAEVEKVLGIATLLFAVLFLSCLVMTFVKRHTLRKKGRTIKLKTSGVTEEEKPNQ
jgi:hypothetical protein